MKTPEGWSKRSIGELAIKNDPGFWGDAPSGTQAIPVIRSTNLRNNGQLCFENLAFRSYPKAKLSSKTLISGDIVLERSGGGPNQPVGRVAIFRRSGVYGFSNFMQRLRIDPLCASPEFTNYALLSLHENGITIQMQQATTGIRNLDYKQYLSFPLLLPPLGEQRKIAAILSSVDEAIEATQAVIEQLGVVKKAMMAELLTRGLPKQHTRFKQTEIGEVPEEWEVVTVGAICERMFVGIAQAATHAYVDEGGVPIIRTTNVRPNLLQSDDVLHINEQFAKTMSSKALREGDVLSARTGYPGTSVVVPAEYSGAQCFTLLVSRPGPRLQGQYLCHTMNSIVGERIVTHGQAGGAQQNLNVGVFEKAQIALPSMEEQDAICNHIDLFYDRESKERAAHQALNSLKSALMSVLLTGEVRVRPDEAP